MLTQSTELSRLKRQPFMAALLLMLTFAMFMTMGCSIVSSLLGGKTSGTVDDLWADVPRLDSLTKSNIDLPLSTRLIIKTAVSAAMGKDGGDFNFIAFTTSKTPKEVMDFYTTQRMTEAGWNSTNVPGCTGDTSGATAVGSLCIFGKQVGKQGTALVLVVAQDESTKQTQLFYVRFEANNLTPTS
ncbi:hypothetical protein BH10CHL1_BH10CHL1_30540 [soil metagenome]